jgi:hypothetical protein
MNDPTPMSPQVFAIMSGLIEEKLGLYYDVSQLDILAERVGSRAAEAGFDSLLDYYYYLRYDPGAETELQLLVEHLVIGETYFFRERRQLQVAVDDFIAQLSKWVHARGSGRLPALPAKKYFLWRRFSPSADGSTRWTYLPATSAPPRWHGPGRADFPDVRCAMRCRPKPTASSSEKATTSSSIPRSSAPCSSSVSTSSTPAQ